MSGELFCGEDWDATGHVCSDRYGQCPRCGSALRKQLADSVPKSEMNLLILWVEDLISKQEDGEYYDRCNFAEDILQPELTRVKQLLNKGDK